MVRVEIKLIWYLIVNLKGNISIITIQVRVVMDLRVKLIVVSSIELSS